MMAWTPHFFTYENRARENVRIDALFVRGSDHVHVIDLDVSSDCRMLDLETYKVWQNDEGDLFFSHPRTGRSLSLKSLDSGELIANGKRAYGWEGFRIVSGPVNRANAYGAPLFSLAQEFTMARLLDCGEALPNGADTLPSHLRKAVIIMS